jgi:hypothetical protein
MSACVLLADKEFSGIIRKSHCYLEIFDSLSSMYNNTEILKIYIKIN